MSASAWTCTDPALEAVSAAMQAMREAFDPGSACPPEAGGSTTVRFLASDGGLPFWDGWCKEPLLWVRVDRRYLSTRQTFPAAFVKSQDCRDHPINVLALEVGVARCSSAEQEPRWDDLEQEALIGLDDSWRIEKALCRFGGLRRAKGHAAATDTIAPVGPEGGVMAWTGMAYTQI